MADTFRLIAESKTLCCFSVAWCYSNLG